MREIKLSADQLIASLLKISETENVCILDSCGVSHLGSHLLVAGISPVELLEINEESAEKTLEIFNRKSNIKDHACIFTISYDFGLKLENIKPRPKEFANTNEPDIFLAVFDTLIIHDYDQKKTFINGNETNFNFIEKLLVENKAADFNFEIAERSIVRSNFTREKYVEIVEQIKEFIRKGDTYQTNLTQQFRAELPETLSPQNIFCKLRKNHPTPFAAFIKRKNDVVISASPERFFKVESGKWKVENENSSHSALSLQHPALIEVSPIKGTRPRGNSVEEDNFLRDELLNSEKDRAENVMIVDLLRNDIGRICEFGTVEVEKLCDIEEHPTYFHLVSTVRGELRDNIEFSEIIRAVFPCGSITGAPKIRTMQIIDELENAERGLSMGAIGFRISGFNSYADLSVAIRTMVVKNNEAIFNVGGGIVIDSEPQSEYEETLTKAKALLDSINGELKF